MCKMFHDALLLSRLPEGRLERHRKICGRPSQDGGAPANASRATTLSPPKGLEQPITQPFTRLNKNSWLHDRPDIDVYRLLVDSYRLRVADEYIHEGKISKGSFSSGAEDGLNGFRVFLDLAESRPGLLPASWNPTKRDACEKLGMDASQWHDLRHQVDKGGIIEHYGDQRFPMQLRMFAEFVLERGIGGANGRQMLQLMASMEGSGEDDGMRASMVDLTTMGSLDLK